MKKILFLRFCAAILILAMASLACEFLTGEGTSSVSYADTPQVYPSYASPTDMPIPSPTTDVVASQQYADMLSRVQEYYQAGYLPSTNGEYHNLDDFSDSWAQIKWYQWTKTPYTVKDFVIRADFYWENATEYPEASGCGFVFRLDEDKDHYMVYLDQKAVIMASAVSSKWVRIGVTKGNKNLPTLGNPAQANFTMLVNQNHAYVYVNDKLYGEFTLKTGVLTSGTLAYTIVSGTNKDYGTRCNMTNVELWQVTP